MDKKKLNCKSSVIDKVAEDIKTAETLAFEKALDDSIHLSNLLTEIYTGQPTKNSIPIIANTDSKSLLGSIYHEGGHLQHPAASPRQDIV